VSTLALNVLMMKLPIEHAYAKAMIEAFPDLEPAKDV
jgi:hypothetical protein